MIGCVKIKGCVRLLSSQPTTLCFCLTSTTSISRPSCTPPVASHSSAAWPTRKVR
jgi:hypothetical protein